MLNLPDSVAVGVTAHNTTASGAAAVINLAAVAGGYNIIDWVVWSYVAAPTTGSITIQDITNNTTLFKVVITDAGTGGVNFGDRGLFAPKGAAVRVTLADGSQSKELNLQYR